MVHKHPRFDPNLVRTVVVNAVTLGVAAGLLANRRRNAEIPPKSWPTGKPVPRVEIIIPARNEERNMGPLLATLLAQNYPAGRWGITVVDDGSRDRTASIVRAWQAHHPQLRLVCAAPLPDGWTGKNHAMYTGFLCSPSDADWLLFVDADTRHAPETLASVVLRACNEHIDLLSLVIDVEMQSFWERVLVPQVGELYTLLVGTMDEVNADKPGGRAAANGQFMLIKRDLYADVGDSPDVCRDVAEDRAIAEACKRRGARVRLEYGRRLVSARVYASLAELWAGYTKTMFWASGHRTGRALLVAAALAWYALAPPMSLAFGLTRGQRGGKGRVLLRGLLELAPMLGVRVAVCRSMGTPARYALTYPLGVIMGDAMLLYSMFLSHSGRGVRWKGRTYKK